ncbi:MAG: CotH kinase family protein [Bacteroidota bacterium]
MKTIHTILFLLLVITLPAQELFPGEGFAFNDEVLPRIDITMDPSDLHIMWDPANHNKDVHYPATFVMSDGVEEDIVENVGVRLRGNTSLLSPKKSIKISFNEYEQGRTYKGLDKMNINGEHNDPSIIRSKLCWDLCEEMEIPASRSNHVQLYINGDYYGVYINVEHIDEEFVELRFGGEGNLYKCLWPGTLEYLGSDPDLYKVQSGGRRIYELKTNEEEDDYSDLAHFIDVLNNTPDEALQCELEKVFNVQDYLKSIALDILTGNWDGPIYNKNNFYLYHNPRTGKFEYIPYDLDNTFGIRWFGEWATRNIYNWAPDGEPRPIYNRIMQNDTYRKQFTYYMSQFLNGPFNETAFFDQMDDLKAMIQDAVASDPYYPLSYGFSISDFSNSYTQGLPSANHVPMGIKEYISDRRASALAQLDDTDTPPIINHVRNTIPSVNQEIVITARVEDESTPSVTVHYTIDGAEFATATMYDDGNHQDGAANDGTFGIVLPSINQTGTLDYYIEANDDTSNTNRSPFCELRTIAVVNTLPLYINEFMSRNETTIADPFGEFDDWIELYNGGDEPIYLGDKFLTDNLDNPDKWQMPDTSIQAGAFLIIWADNDPEQGPLHADFRLSGDGEAVGIFDSDGASIDMVEFGAMEDDEALGRLPNGTGAIQQVSPTPGASNEPLTSIQSLQAAVGISVFPNPSSGQFDLVIDNTNGASFSVRIADQLGRQVWAKKVQNSHSFAEQIALPNQASGLYFLIVRKEDGAVYTERIVLE